MTKYSKKDFFYFSHILCLCIFSFICSTLKSAAKTEKCPAITECNHSLWHQPDCFHEPVSCLCHCKPHMICISPAVEWATMLECELELLKMFCNAAHVNCIFFLIFFLFLEFCATKCCTYAKELNLFMRLRQVFFSSKIIFLFSFCNTFMLK